MKTNRLVLLLPAIALLALLPLAARAAATGDAALLDGPDKGWKQGPARYLLTKEEANEFKKLKTDEERGTFIAGFWTRRDPTPGTERNEFKERYATRLAVVAEKFGPPSGRGWEEDRGMVVLLLGAPDEIRVTGSDAAGSSSPSDTADAPAAGDASGMEPAGGLAPRPRAVFVYTKEILPGMAAPLELEFMGESTGGYRLLSRLDTSNPKLNGLDPLPVPVAAVEAAAPGAGAPDAGSPSAEPPPPAPPTPQETLLSEILAGSGKAAEVGVVTRLDFYKTQSAETLATLTVALEGSGANPIIAARLIDMDEEVAVSLDRADSFGASGEAPPGRSPVYQAAHNVAPGSYSMITAVKDPESGRVGWIRQDVEVPDFSVTSLQISSITLARKVEEVKAPSAPGQRFVLGKFRVIPAPDPVFRAGEELVLYYQIYNASTDPSSGKPRLKVSYRFEKVEAKRNIPLGRGPITQEADQAIQAFAVTIAAVWPGGDYQVEVKVEDVPSGASASAVVPFRVEKEG